MDDDRWPETEHGTVIRRYFHAAGASREMQLAQQKGWEVREVKLNGEQVPENPPRKWWQRPPTRLVRDTNGTVQLRTGTAAGPGDWHPQGRKIAPFALEVTYVRT
jgi:hypothetical protein